MARTVSEGTAEGDEFALIAAFFAPLATHPGARGLKDDAAVWPGAGPTVMTCDAIVEGVHFLPDDPIATVAQKALRVNFSDLAAKGAKPEGVLISLIWPQGRPTSALAGFAQGLEKDLDGFGCALLGGDMTSTPGPLTVSVMAFGRPFGGRCPARADAAPGQDVWVTGTIGDGALGLSAARGLLVGSDDDLAFLIERYRRPQARCAFAEAIASYAGAAMDVSDGLIADARKLAAASGLGLRIHPGAVPMSQAAARALAAGRTDLAALLTGGDDYEVLFTADPSLAEALLAAAAAIGLRLTRIGETYQGQGVAAVLPGGSDLGLHSGGFTHRLGA
jgi:thiamine-monophosphate kinase